MGGTERSTTVFTTVVVLLLGLLCGTVVAAGLPEGAAALVVQDPPRFRRLLRPDPLVLEAPQVDGALLSGIPARLPLAWLYQGQEAVLFDLREAPAGMTLDGDAGVLEWTPPESAEGTTVDVTVVALAGEYQAEVSLQLQVASPTVVAASLSGSTITVTEVGSLSGLAFAFPSQTSVPLAEVDVATVPGSQAPDEPDGVTRLTDFFRVSPVAGLDGMVTVTVPARLLPTAADGERVALYVYSDRATDINGPQWLPLGAGLDLLPGGAVSLQVAALGELCFVGIDDTPLPSSAGRAATGRLSSQADGEALSVQVWCVPKLWSSLTEALTTLECTVSGDVSMVVTVRDYMKSPLFPATTVEEVVGWLAAGRKKIAELGLSADDAVEVVFHTMEGSVAGCWGYVTSAQGFRVLHISSSVSSRDIVQSTVPHELFHNAQARTVESGRDNIFSRAGKMGSWIIEGTAKWFEDEVFDDLDAYRLSETEPLAALLEKGLAAHPNVSRPYHRFAFFKMVADRCPGFAVKDIFNTDLATDPTGLERLVDRLASAEWQCDFKPWLGEANTATLAGALTDFGVTTAFGDDLPDLDTDESAFEIKGRYALDQTRHCSERPKAVRLPPAGGISWLMFPWAGGPDSEAVLRVAPVGGDVTVWVGTGSHTDVDPAAGTSFTTASQTEYTFTAGGNLPPATFVNASTTEAVNVSTWLCTRTETRVPWFIAASEAMRFTPGPMLSATGSGVVTGPEGMSVRPIVNFNEDNAWAGLYVFVPAGTTQKIGVEGRFRVDVSPSQATKHYPEGGVSQTWRFDDVTYTDGSEVFEVEHEPGTYHVYKVKSVFMDVDSKFYDYDGSVIENYTIVKDDEEMGRLTVVINFVE